MTDPASTHGLPADLHRPNLFSSESDFPVIGIPYDGAAPGPESIRYWSMHTTPFSKGRTPLQDIRITALGDIPAIITLQRQGNQPMEIKASELEVIHNKVQHRFEIWIDGMLSELDYQMRGNSIIFYHTGVPPRLEGQGVAARLTQVGLDYAEGKSFNVVPACPYVVAYIRRHPRYKKLIKG